jgi:hypothetical protein
MIEIKKQDKEVSITLKYSESLGGKVKIDILGEGDLSHHLIEGLFDLIDRLARMEKVGHQSAEWRR